ncbi:hypothetical protein ACIRS1_05600 [Kitasatospora sp. NPDC101176]|uniref:hypothetical protein n=1 Tax=Kitasatospora sp. NPDC101176 TaxID=3364099 RepID=UPI0038069B4B
MTDQYESHQPPAGEAYPSLRQWLAGTDASTDGIGEDLVRMTGAGYLVRFAYLVDLHGGSGAWDRLSESLSPAFPQLAQQDLLAVDFSAHTDEAPLPVGDVYCHAVLQALDELHPVSEAPASAHTGSDDSDDDFPDGAGDGFEDMSEDGYYSDEDDSETGESDKDGTGRGLPRKQVLLCVSRQMQDGGWLAGEWQPVPSLEELRRGIGDNGGTVEADDLERIWEQAGTPLEPDLTEYRIPGEDSPRVLDTSESLSPTVHLAADSDGNVKVTVYRHAPQITVTVAGSRWALEARGRKAVPELNGSLAEFGFGALAPDSVKDLADALDRWPEGAYASRLRTEDGGDFAATADSSGVAIELVPSSGQEWRGCRLLCSVDVSQLAEPDESGIGRFEFDGPGPMAISDLTEHITVFGAGTHIDTDAVTGLLERAMAAAVAGDSWTVPVPGATDVDLVAENGTVRLAVHHVGTKLLGPLAAVLTQMHVQRNKKYFEI